MASVFAIRRGQQILFIVVRKRVPLKYALKNNREPLWPIEIPCQRTEQKSTTFVVIGFIDFVSPFQFPTRIPLKNINYVYLLYLPFG